MYKTAMPRKKTLARSAPEKLRVGILLRPHFSLTALAAIVDALRFAADEGAASQRIRCDWTFLAEGPDPVMSSSGIPIGPSAKPRNPERFDAIVVIAGLIEREPPIQPDTLAFIQAADSAGKIVAGIGTGVLPLIQAGLMDGRTCCVHWFRYRDFADRFPKVRFKTDQVLIVDGRYVTCAGAVAAAQFGIWLVARYLSDALAQKCADMLLVQGKFVQPQPPAPTLAKSGRVRRAMLVLEENIAHPLEVTEVASRLGVSARQLQRVFKEEVGITLQAYSRALRLHYGLWQIQAAGRTISEAAAGCGFTDSAHFSRVCLQTYGKRPLAFSPEEIERIADRFGHRASRTLRREEK